LNHQPNYQPDHLQDHFLDQCQTEMERARRSSVLLEGAGQLLDQFTEFLGDPTLGDVHLIDSHLALVTNLNRRHAPQRD